MNIISTTVIFRAALKLTCVFELFEYEMTVVFLPQSSRVQTGRRNKCTVSQTQLITGDDLSAELDAESHSSRSSDPVFKGTKCGATRRSSPGGMQVSSSAAPQTQARVMGDFTVVNSLFICVSMSEIRNKTQLFTMSESFQCIPSLYRYISVRKSLP